MIMITITTTPPTKQHASLEWIRDYNVETPEVPSYVANMTEHKATTELDFPELFLYFLDIDDNNSIESKLRTDFQQQAT